ncbi:hypothetical protein V3425_30560, partial [Pseudomonas aeruginosa]
ESTAVVAVPNEFTRNQLEGRLRTRIEDTLSERLGKPVRLAVSVDPTLEVDPPAQQPPTAPGLAGEPRPPPHTGLEASPQFGGALSALGNPGASMAASPPSAPAHDVRPPLHQPTHRQNDLSTRASSASLTTGIPDSPLNPRYSFETFVIG